MNRRALLGGAAAATLLPLRVSSQSRTALRYGIAPAEDAALAPYAAAKGFFTQQGLDVDLVVLPTGGAITPGILGGSLDMGVTNTGSMAAAHARGVPLVLTAGGSLYTRASPSAHLVSLKSGPIRRARELAGKTVAVSSVREFAHCSVLQWIDRNGGDSTAVNFIELPLPNAVASMQSGHVDAADLIEPFYTRSSADVFELGTPLAAVADGKPVQIFGTVATTAYVRANPDVVKRVAAALRDAARWANDPRNDREASEIVAGFTKIDLATVQAYPRVRFAESIDVPTIQPSIDMLAKYGFIQRAFPAVELLQSGA